MFSMKEIKILSTLTSKDRVTPLKSVGVVGLMKILKDTNYNMSESTLRKYIGRLLKSEYIAYGIKNEQEKKYYITQKGINIINEMTGGNVNE